MIRVGTVLKRPEKETDETRQEKQREGVQKQREGGR